MRAAYRGEQQRIRLRRDDVVKAWGNGHASACSSFRSLG
jgi:hypothetical protein